MSDNQPAAVVVSAAEAAAFPQAASADDSVTDVVSLEGIETSAEADEDELALPVKRRQDFLVEFRMQGKKKALPGAEAVGTYVRGLSFHQRPVTDAPVRRKKKRPVQDNQPWILSMELFDDEDNVVQDFLDQQKTNDEPFKIRVVVFDRELRRRLEAFVFGNVRVISYPTSYDFHAEHPDARTLNVRFEAETMVRKSLTKSPEA